MLDQDKCLGVWDLKRVPVPGSLRGLYAVHPTPTPYKLVRRIVREAVKTPGDYLDPMAGVGSFPICSCEEGRRFGGVRGVRWDAIELEDRYCDFIERLVNEKGWPVRLLRGDCLAVLDAMSRKQYRSIVTYPPMGNPNRKIDYGNGEDQAGNFAFGQEAFASFFERLFVSLRRRIAADGRLFVPTRNFVRAGQVQLVDEFLAEAAEACGWKLRGFYRHVSVGHSPFYYINKRKGLPAVDEEKVLVLTPT